MNRREFSRNLVFTLGALGLRPAETLLAADGNDKPATGGAPATGAATAPRLASGVVFHDRNGSGARGTQAGIPNVRVSNGREFAVTDARGRYQLPIDDDTILFVQKPSGYRVPLSAQNLPRFYYVHKPSGSPANFKYRGVAPTGPLPASIDFPLVAQTEPDKFRVLMFGDPQPRNLQEIDYLARDVVQELVGVEAAFGVSLGDNAFNDLMTLEPLNDVTAQLGLTWHSLIGNHDLNFEAPDDALSAETFKRIYGPTYYSFDYGTAHFVVLDNVVWLGPDTELKGGNYTGGFGEKQLAWLRNDLAGVPRDKLTVLMMHIPLSMPPELTVADVPGKPPRFIEADKRAFLALVQDRPHTVSISGHTHIQYHAFLGRDEGWNGAQPHHHFNCGTTSGSWWSGAPDESGIPHTTMRDGVPNGYAFLNCEGNAYSVQWQVARRDAGYQMNIYAPPTIKAAQAATTPVLVNLFNGAERSKVEMRLGQNGAWMPLRRTVGFDPGYEALKKMEAVIPAFDPAPEPDAVKPDATKPEPANTPKPRKAKRPWRALPAIENAPHLWQTNLPALTAGVHQMQVRATDVNGQIHSERRIIRVV